jgi:Do/DeqQ family serine protease
MLSRIFASIAVLAIALAAPAAAKAQQIPQSVQQMQLSFAPLVKRTSPAVVNIYAKRLVRQVNPFLADPFFAQFFGARGYGGLTQERIENSLGSGVIIDAAGSIATNRHVVEGATEIKVVTSDGREFSAEKVLADDKSDLAILRIETKGQKLPWLELADSDKAEVGDIVLAIGNPFGVGQTVTSGIISGTSRNIRGPGEYSIFIQTDAAINPGNSGGALVDTQGRLLGINTMIFSRDGGSLGIGFAIPANMVRTVIDASRTGAKVVRPWTGIAAQPITPDMVEGLGLQRATGALINRVNPRGPAYKAGIRSGDVILAVNGREVGDEAALKFRMATVPLGTPMKLTVFRKGKIGEATMVAEAPPEDPPREETKIKGLNPIAGATVANISPAVSEELGGTPQEAGVVVMKADEGLAARLGLQAGDILLGINGEHVDSVRQLRKYLDSAADRRWQMQVLRGQQVLNLMITL